MEVKIWTSHVVFHHSERTTFGRGTVILVRTDLLVNCSDSFFSKATTLQLINVGLF